MSPDPDGVELVVESLAAGGDGVARDPAGRVTFVCNCAPGDRVRVRITEERRSYARAEPVEILEPGPHRVAPVCDLFAQRACGGCQWQHIDYPAQVQAKAATATAALRHLLERGLEMSPIEAPVAPLGWRRRARAHWVRPRRSKAAIVGFFAPRSHRIADVSRCPQLEPALERALAVVRERLAPALTGKGEIDLLSGHLGDVSVAVRGPCPPGAAAALAGAGPIASASLGHRRWGAETIELEPGFPGRADWFAQPSRAGNAALLAVVDRAATPRAGARIAELHAGTGNLTRILADGADHVVAVDRSSPPVWLPAGQGVVFRQGAAADVARHLQRKGERFDIAVLDPPRAGAAELIDPLLDLAPARIVYVSCEPATLARDAARLVESGGYRPVRAQVLDLMPQTAHVEVVMRLEKAP